MAWNLGTHGGISLGQVEEAPSMQQEGQGTCAVLVGGVAGR